MRKSDREKIDHIEAFRADLLRYQRMLEAKRRARQYSRDDSEGTNGIGALHESLLRRQATVEPLCDRIVGRFTNGGWNIWDVALHDSGPFNQAYMVGRLAGYVTTLIGHLETSPPLLRRPKSTSQQPTEPRSVLQPINIYGGNVTIAQTASGDISQSTTSHEDLVEVRRLLDDLQAAIRDVQAPDDELEGFLEPVEQLNSELGQSRPLISRLTRSWGAIQAIAAIEGTWQNWDRVQKIAVELGPKAHDLIQVLARGSGNG
jgi:hypothetical protein